MNSSFSRPPTADAGVDLRRWWVIPIACTAIALFFVTGGVPADRSFVQWYTWGLLAYAMIWLDRRLPVAPDAVVARLAWHMPLSLAWTFAYVVLQLSFSRIVDAVSMEVPSVSEAIARGALHWNVLHYWLIIGGYLVVDHAARSRAHDARTAVLERRLLQAQLLALRSQLQPHFLFNALNLISAEVERQPARARKMLEHLGDLLRESLRRGTRDEIPLQAEVELLEHYLAIQRARFAGRLSIEMDLDPGTLQAMVPSLLLQPLVENAIHHGLSRTMRPACLRIRSQRVDDRLLLLVEDDGVGLPPDWRLDSHGGTGLWNTRQRLLARYGADQSLRVQSGAERGVTVVVDLPLIHEEPAREQEWA